MQLKYFMVENAECIEFLCLCVVCNEHKLASQQGVNSCSVICMLLASDDVLNIESMVNEWAALFGMVFAERMKRKMGMWWRMV